MPGWRACEHSRGTLLGRDDGVGGQIAGAAEIFEQRGAHERLEHDAAEEA